MANNNYSYQSLIQFLSYASDKGLLKFETARSRRTAVRRLITAATDDEKNDVRNIDINDLFSRFENLNSQKFKPESLGVYRSRFGTALTDFLRWMENPSGFKPSLNKRTSQRKTGVKTHLPRVPIEESDKNDKDEQLNNESKRNLLPSLIMPVSLTDVAVVIKIENIPVDINYSEAEKIKRILESMANMIEASVVNDASKT